MFEDLGGAGLVRPPPTMFSIRAGMSWSGDDQSQRSFHLLSGLLLGRTLQFVVRKNSHFYAAILLTPGVRIVGRDRIGLPQADVRNSRPGNTQILHVVGDRFGATIGQRDVVLRGADVVGVPFNHDAVSYTHLRAHETPEH